MCGGLLFQWHRTATTQETDGFQVKRPGDVSVRCTLLLMLDYQVRGARTLCPQIRPSCVTTLLRWQPAGLTSLITTRNMRALHCKGAAVETWHPFPSRGGGGDTIRLSDVSKLMSRLRRGRLYKKKCCNAITSSPQPPQFKLDPRLARLLGIHTQTRSCIIQALWQYIKTNKLQDSHDKEYINCDKYFQQVWDSLCA